MRYNHMYSGYKVVNCCGPKIVYSKSYVQDSLRSLLSIFRRLVYLHYFDLDHLCTSAITHTYHTIPLHYIPFHSIPLHFITLHYIYRYTPFMYIYIYIPVYIYIYIPVYIYIYTHVSDTYCSIFAPIILMQISL